MAPLSLLSILGYWFVMGEENLNGGDVFKGHALIVFTLQFHKRGHYAAVYPICMSTTPTSAKTIARRGKVIIYILELQYKLP